MYAVTFCNIACRKFAELAFARACIPIRWEGPTGVTETGVISEGEMAGQVVVRISPKYFRPSEVSASLAQPLAVCGGLQHYKRKAHASMSESKYLGYCCA